jgi:hypothetical protein
VLARLVVIITAMLMAGPSGAQTEGGVLRGLTKVRIVIEDLSSRGTECGLTEQGIRNAIMFPLSSTKIEVAAPPLVPYFYVAISSLHLQSVRLCVSHLRIQVYSYQEVKLRFFNESKFVSIELWKNGVIFSSNPNDHARDMSEVLEELMKKFVTDWNFDNRSSRK